MAVIWQKQTRTTRYEVRSAGRSLRLYTNGVLHTQYHPHKVLTGYVWDLLMLPAFFCPPGSIRRVLVLGLGGGTVIHALRHFAQPQQFVAVELSAEHVRIARRFFNIRGKDIELHCADAVEWVRQYRGEKFDLIIDDLFGDHEGEPMQVMPANEAWLRQLHRHLTPQGMLVKNFVARQALSEMRAACTTVTGRRFKSVFALSSTRDENRVGVFLKRRCDKKDLRDNLTKMPRLSAALRDYHLRQIK